MKKIALAALTLFSSSLVAVTSKGLHGKKHAKVTVHVAELADPDLSFDIDTFESLVGAFAQYDVAPVGYKDVILKTTRSSRKNSGTKSDGGRGSSRPSVRRAPVHRHVAPRVDPKTVLKTDLQKTLQTYIDELKDFVPETGKFSTPLQALKTKLRSYYQKIDALDENYANFDRLVKSYTEGALKDLLNHMGAKYTEKEFDDIWSASGADMSRVANKLIRDKVLEPLAERYGVRDSLHTDFDFADLKRALAPRVADTFDLRIHLLKRGGHGGGVPLEDLLDFEYNGLSGGYQLKFDFAKKGPEDRPLLTHDTISLIKRHLKLADDATSVDVYPQDTRYAHRTGGVSAGVTERQYMVDQISTKIVNKDEGAAAELADEVMLHYGNNAKGVYIKSEGSYGDAYWHIDEDGQVTSVEDPNIGEGDVVLPL